MKQKTRTILLIILSIALLGVLALGLLFGDRVLAYLRTWSSGRNKAVMDYIRHPDEHRDWELEALTRCGTAPFVLPTHGFIGYLYNDSFSPMKFHTGLDIFGGNPVGQTPVYAPYDSFLTRENDWKSSLILRIPQDPLNPGQQIWVYMTHMADVDGNSLIDAAFPPRTRDLPVRQGDLLGYQGNFSGYPGTPTGIHLHVSIVKDDGDGKYLNELQIENTLDPSPYFGYPLNAADSPQSNPVCLPQQ
ncbi:MAG: hypothetical protein PHS75_02560 [Anaerolineaceae bacterium]|nr:hypothetical protein [Anaerolineaceae bacterium]